MQFFVSFLMTLCLFCCVQTVHGNRVTRKCLHMWGQRLCLCQFLNWMDSHKYKCLPSGGFGGDLGAIPTKSIGIGILQHDGSHRTRAFDPCHSYRSPRINHHVMMNHDPSSVNYETDSYSASRPLQKS